ncbi:hypothetical protein KL938_004391 [Ogataea parapolymorpha]|nr:hypothetical protein KL938_004391 [Ogataea parapolymorpha]
MLGITTRSLAGLCRGAEFRYSLSNMDLLVYPGPPTPMWRSVKFSISLRFVSRNADSPASRNRFLPMHAMSGSMSLEETCIFKENSSRAIRKICSIQNFHERSTVW